MRVLLVDEDAGARKRLRRELEARGHAAETARDGVEAWHRVREGGFDALVSALHIAHMDGLELARSIRRTTATREMVLLLLGSGDPIRLLAARDAVDDVLPTDVDTAHLIERLEALHEQATAPQEGDAARGTEGRVVVVTSAKGGAGVSTVAANLAIALAMTTELRVAAVDLDLEYGDLPMLLDLHPTSSLPDLAGAIAVDGDAVVPEDHLAGDRSGLRVLAASPSPVEGLRVDEVAVRSVLGRLATRFDVLVADLPPGFSDPAVAALLTARRIVLVVTPDVTTLRRTRAFLEVLADLEVPQSRVLMLLNVANSAGGLGRERAEQLLGRRFVGEVPHAPDLFARAAIAGDPAVRLEPVGEVARAFLRLSERVLLAG